MTGRAPDSGVDDGATLNGGPDRFVGDFWFVIRRRSEFGKIDVGEAFFFEVERRGAVERQISRVGF